MPGDGAVDRNLGEGCHGNSCAVAHPERRTSGSTLGRKPRLRINLMDGTEAECAEDGDTEWLNESVCPTCGDDGCPSLIGDAEGCPLEFDPPEGGCDVLLDLIQSGAPFDADDVLDAWPYNDWPTSYDIDWVSIFRQVGVLSDCEHEPRCRLPAGTLQVYRGAIEEHVRHPSWSLSREVAEDFVERLTYRRRSDAQVWRAEVSHEFVLAYFCSQDQQEVVVDPAGLLNVTSLPP